MKNIKLGFIIFLIITFILGLYMYVFKLGSHSNLDNILHSVEGMKSSEQDIEHCPNILINMGNELLLYDSTSPKVAGVNPIHLANLDEYIKYAERQRKLGKKCPILYLQQEISAQGGTVYRIRPSPFDQQGGLQSVGELDGNVANLDKSAPISIIDSNRDNGPYNKGNYPGFDPYGLHQGTYTVIDQVHDSTSFTQLSDNPLDSNWGGVLYTENAIRSGKYEENNVTKPRHITPKGTVNPDIATPSGLKYPTETI